MLYDIERYWDEFASSLPRMPHERLARVAEALLDCQKRGGTIFALGNGGSAATASHFACDLAKGTRAGGGPTFRVIALTDNVPLLTAWANDTDYERVFAEQLAALAHPGDVVVAISASGNSPNVLAAVHAASACGATTIAWTGATGGRLADLADIVVRAPMRSIEQVEDAHLLIGHSICVALREQLLASDAPVALAPRRRRVAHDVLAERVAAASGDTGE